jgi:hypothetical protein
MVFLYSNILQKKIKIIFFFLSQMFEKRKKKKKIQHPQNEMRLVENGFFLLLPDKQTLRTLQELGTLQEKLHLTILVADQHLDEIEKKFKSSCNANVIDLKQPFSVKVTGNSLLPGRSGAMFTALNVEREPCAIFKSEMVKNQHF